MNDNFNEMTIEQMAERIKALESELEQVKKEKSELSTKLYLTEFDRRKYDLMETTLKTVGVAMEYYSFKERKY